jgi:HEPN domain-containing protein
LPKVVQDHLEEISEISRELRKDRELAFYGTEDWIPTDEYNESHSLKAIEQAQKIYAWVSQALGVA